MSEMIILSDGSKIKSFNTTYLTNIKIENLIKRNYITTIVGKVGLIITEEDNVIVKELLNYFTNTSLKGFCGTVLFVSVCYEDKLVNNNNIVWGSKVQGILKGKDIDYTYFVWEDMFIKKGKNSKNIYVYLKRYKNNYNVSYLVKIIESAIIEEHTNIGFFPLHGGLVNYDIKNRLILGDSQSGKTTLLYKFKKKGGIILSDDIVFIDILSNMYAYGQYTKEVIKIDDANNSYIEKNGEVSRKICKIKVKNCLLGLDEIIITNISGYKNFIKLEENKTTKKNLIQKLIINYPCEFFVDKSYNYSMANIIMNSLIEKPVFIYNSSYNNYE